MKKTYSQRQVETLIFDLGGVFVKLSGVNKMMEWTEGRFSEEELWSIWLNSEYVRNFETGKINSESFATGVIQDYELQITSDEFLFHFFTWSLEIYPGTLNLLSSLRKSYTLVSLSNTNEFHWNKLCDHYQLDQYFDYNFPSHKTGLIKPDFEVYDFVLNQIPSTKHQAVFFDDTLVNIESARLSGISSFQVKELDGLTETLKTLDII